MPKQIMTVDTAVALLNALGCGGDPVVVLEKKANFRQGEEVEVNALCEFQFLLSPHTAKASSSQIPASKVRIRFYGRPKGGSLPAYDATLLDLLKDRLGDYRGI